MSTTLPALALSVPGGNIETYIQSISRIPVLTADEEKVLADRLHYEQDLEAARQLVMSHLRFVVHIAKSYAGYGLNQSDLIQEGNVGLMKAVKRFNPEYGVRLVSFAVHWIKAEIHEFIIRNWKIVKVATTKAQRKLFFNLRGAKKHLGWLSADETKNIADDLGVDQAVVREMEGRLSAHDLGFDAGSDDDDESSYSAPAHFIEDNSFNPAHAIEHENTENDANERLHQALSTLDERSQDILAQRWLVEDKATLHDLAAKYQISAERIRQLEQNAMKKVKKAMLPVSV